MKSFNSETTCFWSVAPCGRFQFSLHHSEMKKLICLSGVSLCGQSVGKTFFFCFKPTFTICCVSHVNVSDCILHKNKSTYDFWAGSSEKSRRHAARKRLGLLSACRKQPTRHAHAFYSTLAQIQKFIFICKLRAEAWLMEVHKRQSSSGCKYDGLFLLNDKSAETILWEWTERSKVTGLGFNWRLFYFL